MRRAVAGGAGGGRRDAATASHLNAATFPESKEPECNVPPMLMLLLSLLVGAARVAEDLSDRSFAELLLRPNATPLASFAGTPLLVNTTACTDNDGGGVCVIEMGG